MVVRGVPRREICRPGLRPRSGLRLHCDPGIHSAGLRSEEVDSALSLSPHPRSPPPDHWYRRAHPADRSLVSPLAPRLTPSHQETHGRTLDPRHSGGDRPTRAAPQPRLGLDDETPHTDPASRPRAPDAPTSAEATPEILSPAKLPRRHWRRLPPVRARPGLGNGRQSSGLRRRTAARSRSQRSP